MPLSSRACTCVFTCNDLGQCICFPLTLQQPAGPPALVNQGSELRRGHGSRSLESSMYTYCLAASGPLASGASWLSTSQEPSPLGRGSLWTRFCLRQLCSLQFQTPLFLCRCLCNSRQTLNGSLVKGSPCHRHKKYPSLCVTPRFSLSPICLVLWNSASGDIVYT